MGWFSNKRDEANAKMDALMGPQVGPGEVLQGTLYAAQQARMSVSNWVIGVTDQRLILIEVDRKMLPTGLPVSLAPTEISVGNIFSDGAFFSVGTKGQQIRFEARGEKYAFTMLGGNLLENALAGDQQASSVDVLGDFLRTCRATAG